VSPCEHAPPDLVQIRAHLGDPSLGPIAWICRSCHMGALLDSPDRWKPIEPTYPDGARLQFAAIGDSDEPRGPSASPWRTITHENGHRLRYPVRCF